MTGQARDPRNLTGLSFLRCRPTKRRRQVIGSHDGEAIVANAAAERMGEPAPTCHGDVPGLKPVMDRVWITPPTTDGSGAAPEET